MIATSGRAFRWKRPEYVGENRCLPCTVLNFLVAALVAVGAGAVRPSLGVVAAAVGIAAIYFRGYLIPGTPTLTRRYLPDRAMRLFGKRGNPVWFASEGRGGVDAADPADVERVLTTIGALEPCRVGEDLCLTPRFRDAWDDKIDRLDGSSDADGAVLEPLFRGLDATDGSDLGGRVDAEERPNSFVALVGSRVVGKWESRAAAIADVAADSVLRARAPAWKRFSYGERMQFLGALRLWIDRCPACDGAVTLDEETVQSCCRSYDVAAATCDDCGTRLFEARYSSDER